MDTQGICGFDNLLKTCGKVVENVENSENLTKPKCGKLETCGKLVENSKTHFLIIRKKIINT